MADSVNLEMLSTRSGFNSAVRHIKKTMEIGGNANSNLGDIIYEMQLTIFLFFPKNLENGMVLILLPPIIILSWVF